jgi:hypothetical protein
MDDQLRKLLFSVEDEEGHCLKDVLVRFYLGNKVRAEAVTTCEQPLEFSTDPKVEIVDVEIFFGEIREWLKVPMDSGHYTHKVKLPQKSPRRSPFQTPQVIAAVIALIGVLVVGYWQFVYKAYIPPHTAQLRVVVRELSNQFPIPNAQVEIADGAHHLQELSDQNGYTGSFPVAVSGAGTIAVMASAGGFERTTINLDRPSNDETATLILKKTTDVTTRTSGTVNRKSPLIGTWQVVANDPNSLIKNGTFTFSTSMPDGSVDVTAQFAVDAFVVHLDGRCTIKGQIAQMTFDAGADSANSWSGTGDFRLDSPTRITGRIQSKRGDDVPFALVK